MIIFGEPDATFYFFLLIVAILVIPFVMFMQLLNNRAAKKVLMKREAKMIKCPSCETLNYRDANFCQECGNPRSLKTIST